MPWRAEFGQKINVNIYLRPDKSTFKHAIFQFEDLYFCYLLLKAHQKLERQKFSSTFVGQEMTEIFMCLSIPTECKPFYI